MQTNSEYAVAWIGGRWLPGLAIALALAVPAVAEDPSALSIVSPQEWQVLQRQDFVMARSWEHHPGGPQLGHADVTIRLTLKDGVSGPFEVRTQLTAGCRGRAIEWMPLEVTRHGEQAEAKLRIPAGGWYRLELRGVLNGEPVTASVERVGVGEVLMISGQSYAAGANDELMEVTDPYRRVSRFNPATRAWEIADDPQPGRGDGGTIWPPLGDHLAGLLEVPIGLVNVAVGGTASRQWLPGEPLFEQMAVAGEAVPQFRAVLWQQGESDVIESTTTENYVKNLVAIRNALAERWGQNPPWLLARSTLHPTVYNEPQREATIRAAIDQLIELHGFLAGPDTDLLGGANRGGPDSRRHFTGPGQRHAALLWLVAVWNHLDRHKQVEGDR